MQQTIKWQTHLSYLHVEKIRVHNPFSENKVSTQTPSWVTELASYAHALSSVERF